MEELNLYHATMQDFPLLTKQEEIDLSAQVKRGDESARERMILSNLKLVVTIARQYEGLGMPLSDLVSEGNIGLMTAVEKFDAKFGAKFSTYAALWIHQKIMRCLTFQSHLIRLPQHIRDQLHKLNKAEALGDEATAEKVGVSPEKMDALRTYQERQIVSFDTPIGDDGEGTLSDVIAVEENRVESITDKHEVNGPLANHVCSLDRRSKLILTMRFGLNGSTPKTLEEVGAVLGVTRERVRQIEFQCLKKLRHAMTASQTSTAE